MNDLKSRFIDAWGLAHKKWPEGVDIDLYFHTYGQDEADDWCARLGWEFEVRKVGSKNEKKFIGWTGMVRKGDLSSISMLDIFHPTKIEAAIACFIKVVELECEVIL